MEPGSSATDRPSTADSAGNARVRPDNDAGDELLRHLPADRRTNEESIAPVVAVHKTSATRSARIEKLRASLQTGPEAIFLTVFATLLARLAGQPVVHLHDISAQPAMVVVTFDDKASFRTTMRTMQTIKSENQPADHADNQPAHPSSLVEYLLSAVDSPLTTLPPRKLRLVVQLSVDECELKFVSSTGLWSQPTLQLWLRYFDHLLAAIAAEPDAPWKTLPLLDPAEAKAFYFNLNSTAEAYPEELCIHDLVMRQVERSPDAVAVASDTQSLTYAQLHQRSNAIARSLLALGAGSNRPVAVCLERSAELPIALLAVLKAGSCYVPLDPQDSRLRLGSILEECRPIALITDPSFSLPLDVKPIPVVHPQENTGLDVSLDYTTPAVSPEHQAYVIYTSGTTGKPKGVPILHRALVNLITSMIRAPGFTPADRMLAVAPISFDIATMDMFLPLACGGTLVVADRLAAADPFRLAALLNEFAVTVLQATPVTWRLLTSSDWEGKRDLKMICGGEALPRDLANQLLPQGKELWNCYGPTETTIWSSVLQVQSDVGVVPIGPPIANTTFYVLDDQGRLLPPGVPGELYIGGTGVSPGYLEPPQGAVRRFLQDPYADVPGSRMFRTGDLVRLINGNQFEFFGRLDHQVKLRGYRIELGEIEFALRSSPDLVDAVAALHDGGLGEPYLIAYVTSANQKLDLQRLRDHVSQWLPAYMVPSRFVLLQSIPLTSSGKVDRKALSASASSALSAFQQPEGVKPRTGRGREASCHLP